MNLKPSLTVAFSVAASLGFRHATVNDLSNVYHAKQFGK